jgi:long-chain fatty acid transport protein
MPMKQTTRYLVLLTLAVLCPLGAHALGYRFPNQDPEAIARGNAFVATADNPSAIYYNPAGITQLEGQNVRAVAYFASPGYEYESPSGASASASSDIQVVPGFFYTFSEKELPLSFGLGVYAPYGLSLDWGQNTPFRTVAEKGQLRYISINPVVAWQVLPHLSLAAGPTFNYSDAKFQRGIGFMPVDEFKLDGSGWGYGFNAGALWEPHKMWAVGLNYRSTTTVDYSGSTELLPYLPVTLPSSASIKFPQYIVGGVSFRPTDKWNFEVDVDWTDWEQANNIPISAATMPEQVWPLNYRSSFMYEFGVTRQLSKGYFVSMGYIYSENSSPDQTFNPIIPDTDLHLGSVGFGHKGRNWDWAAAYHFGYNSGREVKNDIAFPTAEGTYKVLNHCFSLAATFKF